MNDDTLRRQLQRIQGDDPSPEFVDRVRLRLGEGPRPRAGLVLDGKDTTVVGLDRSPVIGRRSRLLWPLAAAAVLVVGALVALQVIVSDDAETDIAATSEIRLIGDAWLRSIINGDREAFVALHASDVEVDDTLMGFSEDSELLTSARIFELYYDGFDALQAALDIDNDVIRSDGCEETGPRAIRCAFTATMIGTNDYNYTVVADIVAEDRLITSIDFTTATDPADFRLVIQDFLDEEATDEDRACLVLGFNTLGCGQHESDFLTRYATYYEAQLPTDE